MAEPGPAIKAMIKQDMDRSKAWVLKKHGPPPEGYGLWTRIAVSKEMWELFYPAAPWMDPDNPIHVLVLWKPVTSAHVKAPEFEMMHWYVVSPIGNPDTDPPVYLRMMESVTVPFGDPVSIEWLAKPYLLEQSDARIES